MCSPKLHLCVVMCVQACAWSDHMSFVQREDADLPAPGSTSGDGATSASRAKSL